jgi:hypothetical protein
MEIVNLTGNKESIRKVVGLLLNCPDCVGKEEAIDHLLEEENPAIKLSEDEEDGIIATVAGEEFHVIV